MPNEVLVKDGTALVWADTTDYSGSGGTRTDQIDLTSVADGAARQGAKADLGATRARQFIVDVGLEFAVAPTSGEIVEIYWAGSHHATAGTANPGGTSGADAAYTGTAGDSLADSVKQLIHVGNLICTADATTVVQYQQVGVLLDIPRYGMPVVKNESGQALVGDAVEMFVRVAPLVDEVQ